ncbi:hypothetical protein VTK56DRAFT_9985 [Thermocarpiscus australiensis]
MATPPSRNHCDREGQQRKEAASLQLYPVCRPTCVPTLRCDGPTGPTGFQSSRSSDAGSPASLCRPADWRPTANRVGGAGGRADGSGQRLVSLHKSHLTWLGSSREWTGTCTWTPLGSVQSLSKFAAGDRLVTAGCTPQMHGACTPADISLSF